MKLDTLWNQQIVKASLLLILLSCFSTSTSAVFDGPMNPSGCTFNDLQNFYLKELGIEGVKLKYKRQRMKNPYMRGFTRPLNNGAFLIALADGLEPSEIRITMAHELVHVRQLLNDKIKRAEFEKHYMIRSFEDEAFRLSLPLAIKFYTKHTCNH
ncbi:hypothetical protein [uncultured Endozoicomonas sp.]|uniref:hypothetical protein n=1 Tax=uncultured Endozoicomonas sp. TaxID=432652 RepID=UPI002632542E|nr:hypothetical protein [uncultured Endozoicomonas sp.]